MTNVIPLLDRLARFGEVRLVRTPAEPYRLEIWSRKLRRGLPLAVAFETRSEAAVAGRKLAERWRVPFVFGPLRRGPWPFGDGGAA